MLNSETPDLKQIYHKHFGRFRFSNVAPTKPKQVKRCRVYSSHKSTKASSLFCHIHSALMRQLASRLSICEIPISKGNLSIYLRTVKILRPLTFALGRIYLKYVQKAMFLENSRTQYLPSSLKGKHYNYLF